MKKNFFVLLIMSMTCLSAMADKNIRSFSNMYYGDFAKSFDSTYYAIDSVAIEGALNAYDFEMLRQMTVHGRLKGIDLSRAKMNDGYPGISKIPYCAFCGFGDMINSFKRDIYIDRMTPPLADNPFAGFNSEELCTLYVPVGAKQNYLDAPYFKDFYSIIETSELTGGPTAIDGVESGVTERDNGYADGVYTLDGKRIADTMTDGMAKGLYVVKRGAVISKVAVR